MSQKDGTSGYLRPSKLEDALGYVSANRPQLLAGGTDVYPSLQGGVIKGHVLDLTAIASLRGIRKEQDHWVIGALTTWSDIARANLPSAFQALQQAAREVGSTQIQNRGTIAGNICNASPAADGVPALLVLDAEVILTSSRGQRQLPLDQFILGNRKTALAPDEIVSAVRVPLQAVTGTSSFMKLGARRYLVISIAMIATRLVLDEVGHVKDCAISVGACSAVAQRLRELEQGLIGMALKDVLSDQLQFAPELMDGLSPIDDVRAPASYRREAVAALIVRSIHQTAHQVTP